MGLVYAIQSTTSIISSNIENITNDGVISGGQSGIFQDNDVGPNRTARIGTIINNANASITTRQIPSVTQHYGIANFSSLGPSIIENIINYGSITGAISGIANVNSRISNFHNATAVTITGNLPANYFVIIRRPNDYGRLSWLNIFSNSTVMRFGVSTYSTGLAAGTYTAVLSNIDRTEIHPERSGTIGRFDWELRETGTNTDTWDLTLRWLGSDPANTLLALQSNSLAVRSVLSQRATATTFALDYDCSVFDQHGVCVSVGARNTQMGNNYSDTGETAGILTAAYRVTQEFRIGGFIDQNLVAQSPVGVDPKNTQPMLGAFAVYQESPSFAGLTIRAALAYQEGDLRITRPEIADTEPGTGRARTSAFAFGGEIAYGFPLDGTWVAQPYAGLRRSDSQRRGYTETTSSDVEYPLTYNRFGQQVTSATAGLRLRGAITPEFSLTFGAGMEHDLDSKMDRYAGRSTIAGLETFSINASQQQNETRAVGSAGMRYMIASNQALAFDASVRQMPYGNDPSITTMLRYSIGF